MVDVLMLVRDHVELAVRGALTADSHDGRAVAVLARRSARDGGAEGVLRSQRSNARSVLTGCT
jgi:hypothetical protein